MPEAFRLTVKDASHESWRFSVTKNTVYVIAYSEEDARRMVGDSLYRTDELPKPEKYQKQIYPASPWYVHDVTSCDRDTSGAPRDGIHVVAEDGEKWSIWLPGT